MQVGGIRLWKSGVRSDGSTSVIWRDRPFSDRIHKAALPQGLTCAEIVASVPDLDLQHFLRVGVVCVNGQVVPREMWQFVRPKSREDVLVTLHMPILGGGKDSLRIVAAIALVIIATAITGGAAAGLFPGTGLFVAGSISAQILAGAVTFGGALLLGAFVKPPASNVEEKESSEEASKQAGLQGNQLKRGGSIPRVVGTHRVFPAFLSQPLVDLDGYDEVIEGVYGLAGPHQIRDIKFGDVFVDDIDPDQLEYEFYELSDDDTGIDENVKLWARLVGAQDSVEFSDDAPVPHTISPSGDGVYIDRRAGYIATAAAYFDGNAHLSLAAIASYFWGDNDGSIDLFCELDNSIATPGLPFNIFGQTDSSEAAATSAFKISKTAAGLVEAIVYDGSVATTLTSTASIEAGIHHIALARVSGLLSLWVDGILQASTAFSGTIPASTGSMDIGGRGAGSTTSRWIGWISNVRFSIGSSWYTAGTNFTPPVIHYKQEEPTLVTRYGKTATPQILMSEHTISNEKPNQSTRDVLANQDTPARSTPQAQTVAVRGRGFDEVWVTLTFPGGLFYTDAGFDEDWFNGMPFRIRVRSLGTDTWFNLPEIHIHDRRTSQFSRMLVFRWDNDAVLPPGNLPLQAPPPRKGWRTAYYSVPVQTVDPTGIGGWTADSHFYDGSGDTYFMGGFEPGEGTGVNDEHNFATTGLLNIILMEERVEFYLDGLVEKGPIEVEIRRGQLYIADEFTYPTYVLSTDPPTDDLVGGVYDFFGWATLVEDDEDQPVVVLKRSNASDEVVISRVSSVWNDSPVAREGVFATIYAKVTGRNLDALSVLGSGLVPDWDGSGWSGLHATSNPAPHYRDVLVGNLNDNRIPAALINDTTMLEWRQRCSDLEFECNAVFNGEGVDRVLEVIASCGYARPRQSETWDVAQDRDFSSITPVQMFTPRNMRNFRWEKAFLRHRPDGLRVRYNDAFDDYVEHTLVVPRLGFNAAVNRLEEIRYDGITTEYHAVLKALYDQQQVIDRFTFYHGEVDAESLVCRRGDLVVVQHDIIDHFAGFSRVLSIEEENGVAQSIRLDGTVSPIDAFFTTPTLFFETPTTFFTSNVGAAVRLKNGTIVSFQAALSEDGFTLTPTTPVSTEAMERECLVTTGRLLRANRRMLVYNIRPRADLVAEVTFVDESPQLWQFPEPLDVGEEFMRNRLINGEMELFQRDDSVTVASATTEYTLDRWYVRLSNNGGQVTVTQEVTDPPPGFDNYLRVTVDAAVDPIAGSHELGQVIEKVDLRGLDWGRSSARQVALAFSVRSSVAGSYYGVLHYNAAGDDHTYVFSFTIPVANEWFRRIVTVPAPDDADGEDSTALLYVEFSLGGADDDTADVNQWINSSLKRGLLDDGVMATLGATFDLAGVQLEPAPATQYEWLPVAMRKELAKRYYQAINFNSEPIDIGSGVAISTTVARIIVPLTTPLRVPPIVDLVAANNLSLVAAAGSIAATAVALDSPLSTEVQALALLVTVAAGLTAGQAVALQLTASFIAFDSEVDPN